MKASKRKHRSISKQPWTWRGCLAENQTQQGIKHRCTHKHTHTENMKFIVIRISTHQNTPFFKKATEKIFTIHAFDKGYQ